MSLSAGPVATRPTGARGRPQSLLLVGIIAGAWLLAVAAELTGRAEVVHHGGLVASGQPMWAALGLFFVAWQVHVVAMMLPSSLPLIRLFNRAAANQPRPRMAQTMFLGGYLAVWTGFGFAALTGDAVLHLLVDQWAWLAARPHVIGGGVLLLAGAFQFSALKDRCLQQCRHPAVFLQRHYRRGIDEAFALGCRHGVFCLGCCGALMLVMFSVGIANLAWMAPFALLMLYEKTGSRGERGARPIGIGLLGLGALVLLNPGWMPTLLLGH